MYVCGILTVSDSSFYNNKDDVSGRFLFDDISARNKFKTIIRNTVPDDFEAISNCLRKWTDEDKVDLILTTGGTGMTSRDITPEATKSILEKEAPSISQAMLIDSLRITKFAMFSRGVCGIRKTSLIINLPGSPKAVKECIAFLSPVFEHALDQLSEKHDVVKACHAHMQSEIKSTISTLPVDVMNRPRNSPFPLLSVSKALEIVLSQATRLSPFVVKLDDSLNLVNSKAVHAVVNVPPFPASIKDGYAVRFADGAGRREVISISNAGDDVSLDCVDSGKCARISTGAELPRGADAVVQVEDTELMDDVTNADKERYINIMIAPEKVGQDIRPIGNDLKVGDVLIDEGVVMGPCEIGLLAMGGIQEVACYRRPIVGVLSTGNELVSHNDQQKNMKIIDCNRPLLLSFYKGQNCDVVDLGIVLDEPQIIFDSLKLALKSCDVIVTTGGVSMGEKDYLKSVLASDLQAEIHFGRILMKPGKPTTFSSICNMHTDNINKLVFSLPGNPVSAFVTSYLLVLPAIKKMAGLKHCEQVPIKAKLRHDVTLDPRPDYRRCKLWVVESLANEYSYEVSCMEFGNQMSSRLSSCIAADGLICLPPISDVNTNVLGKDSLVSVLKF